MVRLPEGGAEPVDAVRYRLAVRLSVVCAVTAAVSVLSLWPLFMSNPATGSINLLVAVSFVATGVALAETPLHRTSAYALIATAGVWLMSWWWAWPVEWQVGPLPLLSNLFGYLWFVFGGIALLRYPGPVLATRFERVYFLTLAGWICIGKIVIAVVSEPEWERLSPVAWWLTVHPNRPLHDALLRTFYIGIIALAVVMLFLLLAKLQRSRGMDRLDSLPVTVAACTVAVSGGINLWARLLDFAPPVIEALQTAMGVAALVTPLAFLMTVLRRRLAYSAVADLVVRIAGAPTTAHVEHELRRVLQDPSLALWVWNPGEGRYENAELGICSEPRDETRWRRRITASNGECLAVLILDESLRRHPTLIRSALVATGLALEVQAQLAEVSASRLRITTAAVDERRRIERALHDGAQQRLLAVSARLSAARLRSAANPDAVDAIDDARDDLREALVELRRLARGIHPAVLSQSGLPPALEDVAERLPLQVELCVPAGRWADEVEVTVYFLVCEALTNSVRHGHACSASVVVTADRSSLTVVIRDDGCGGARAVNGSGLAGMRDRVHALGGTLLIDSPAGEGTVIRAVLPCG
jgi:signal transduction histidine kinase